MNSKIETSETVMNSPEAKRKRPNGQQVEGDFEVEEVIGYKLESHEPRFHIKWKSLDLTHITWEPIAKLVKHTVFQQFIHNSFKAFDTVIERHLSSTFAKVFFLF